MAPRSTGCRACVRRKVKCDETRPSCKRCVKAGTQCPGFPQDLFKFVDETQDVSQRHAPPRRGREAPKAAESSVTILVESEKATPQMLIADELGLCGPRENVYICYLLERFFSLSARYQDLNGHREWISICLTESSQLPTASIAIRCLAAGFFGRRHHQESITAFAGQGYGQALRSLHDLLHQPDGAQSHDAIAATTALNMYEYVNPTTGKAWIKHARGVARLMEFQGAQRFKNYPARLILEVNKPVLCAEALTNRKRIFLENKEWQSVYDPYQPRASHISRLWDLVATMPGTTEDILGLEHKTSLGVLTSEECDETILKLDLLKIELKAWYATWTGDLGQQRYEVPASSGNGTTSDANGPLFTTLLHYEFLESANVFVLHDAVMIAILEWTQKVIDLSQGKVHIFGEISEARHYAYNICRSVEYHLQTQNIEGGAFYIIMPARSAYLALPKPSRVARWLIRLMLSLGWRSRRRRCKVCRLRAITSGKMHIHPLHKQVR